MNSKLLIVALITLVASAYGTTGPTSDQLPNMIFVYYEGTPRAHLPVVAWFSGKMLPVMAPDKDNHDVFWRGKLDAAPRFYLETDVYADLSNLLIKLTGEKKNLRMWSSSFTSQSALWSDMLRRSSFSR